jgi:hypothetical protein
MQEPKHKAGRPRREPAAGERVGLSLRVTPETKRALDFAAEQAGRSLSQEAELWLEQSKGSQRLLFDALELVYGRELAGLLIAIGDAMKSTAEYEPFTLLVGDESVWENPWRYDQMAKAAERLIDQFRPNGKIVQPRQIPIALGTVTDPKQRAAFQGDMESKAQGEINLGVSMAERRLARLANDNQPDPAREPLGKLAHRGKKK